MNIRSMTKKKVCVKNTFLDKNTLFSLKKKEVPNKNYFGVNPNTKYVQAYF